MRRSRVFWGALSLAALSAGGLWAQPASSPDAGLPVSGAAVSAPDAVRQVFASHRFQFCHEPDYPLTPAEKQWCDLGAGDNRKGCPSLHEVCGNQASAKQLELRKPFSFHLPELGGPARVLLWSLLGIGLALLIFALVRRLLDHHAKPDVVATEAAPAGDQAAAALARQVETDVQRLLERARAKAAAGDFRAAIGDAYAAWLRRLEGAGLVHVEPDQTNGDYLRRVKGERPHLAARMAEVVGEVEGAQFGQTPPTRDRFEGVWARVTGLLGDHLGPSLLVAWLGVALVGCGQPRADWDDSPSGRSAVTEYLRTRGFEVHERLLSVSKIADSKADQLVLLPGAHLGDEDWKALAAWVIQSGHALLVAGGARSLPPWIGAHLVEKAVDKSEPVAPTASAAERLGPLTIRVPAANRVEGGHAEALLGRKAGVYAVERFLDTAGSAAQDRSQDGEPEEDEEGEEDEADQVELPSKQPNRPPARVLVLADDYLFRNASLLVADNALALEKLLRDGGTRLELVGDLTGLVSSNPVEAVERGRLGPALLQLAAVLLLFFVCKGARFGRPVQAQSLARREFAEHVRALGLHYARAHAERYALACWGNYAIERLRECCGSQVDLTLSGLAETVALRTGRPVGEVMRLFVEARDARAGVPAEKGARDLETVAALAMLLKETGGPGGHKHIQSHV